LISVEQHIPLLQLDHFLQYHFKPVRVLKGFLKIYSYLHSQLKYRLDS